MSSNQQVIQEDSYSGRWQVNHLGFLAFFTVDINPEDFLPPNCPSYVKLSFVIDEIEILYRHKGEIQCKCPKNVVFEGIEGCGRDTKIVTFRFCRFEQPTFIELDALKTRVVSILNREIEKEAEAHIRSWETSMIVDIEGD